jgi:peptidoglycan hydrolase-like protein with peptidoglycan-binding domain
MSVIASMVALGAPPVLAAERPTLREGSSGDAVLVLEQRLVELGYQVDVVDTYFGSDTRSSVLAFQAAAAIGRDGIVGPITWGALDRGVQNPVPAAPTDPGPPPTPDPTPAPTPDPNPPASPTSRPTLRQGSSGPEVLALEQRLSGLGYWVDTVDGSFGSGTHHAVVALQKAAGIGRDGVVGPITWATLDAGTRPAARTTSGHVIEVDLTRQLLLVVDDGAVREVHDTSTGRVAGTTPAGTWTITRQVDGYRYAPLGVLYRPKYFYGGVAIHGYPSVPASPASHGCVRVTNQSMDHLWASGVAPVGATVRVYR